MRYKEIQIKTDPSTEVINDILCAICGEAGCESFLPQDDGIIAYAQDNLLDEETLKNLLDFFPIDNVQISYIVNDVAHQDWNEEWEKNSFEPIVIGNECVVHGSNHTDIPLCTYDILINPRLAFGSGHHQTTRMMMNRLLQMDLLGKSVLDMGCGTCILGILAKMRDAERLVGIDIDEWSVENSKENLELNKIDAEILLGDATLLNNYHFDVILANINRNILLADMKRYVDCLNDKGILLMSGFYIDDIHLIREEGERLGLIFVDHIEDDNWACVKLVKE